MGLDGIKSGKSEFKKVCCHATTREPIENCGEKVTMFWVRLGCEFALDFAGFFISLRL